MRRIDTFSLLLIGTVAFASIFPASGSIAIGIGHLTRALIFILFFLHGARLSNAAAMRGLRHWRLHLFVLACSFLLFPLVIAPLGRLIDAVIDHHLYMGLVFLCCLPSTVQSSIAFVSMARGNIPAAVCAASLSNLLGVFITPLLVALLLSTAVSVSTDTIKSLLILLLLPFLLGQLLRRWVGRWVERQAKMLSLVDRGSVLLIVYSAFSSAVAGGFWRRVDALDLAALVGITAALLGIVLTVIVFTARRAGFSTEDEIAILFCGSQKSLVTGAPMASIIFPASIAGVVTIPIMIYHQLQLLTAAFVARRYALRCDAPGESPPSTES